MKEQKSSLMIIFVLFVASAGADISKNKDECVAEFVHNLKNNIKADENFKSSRSLNQYAAIRLIGERIPVIDLIDLYATLFSVDMPEEVTIITITRYFEHSKGFNGDSEINNVLSLIQRYCTDKFTGETFRGNLGVKIHVLKKDHIKDYDFFNEDTTKIKMINSKLCVHVTNYFRTNVCLVIISVLIESLYKAIVKFVYDNQEMIYQGTENLKPDVDAILKIFYTYFEQNLMQRNLAAKMRDSCFLEETSKKIYSKIVDYEKSINMGYYRDREMALQSTVKNFILPLLLFLETDYLQKIVIEIYKILSEPKNKLKILAAIEKHFEFHVYTQRLYEIAGRRGFTEFFDRVFKVEIYNHYYCTYSTLCDVLELKPCLNRQLNKLKSFEILDNAFSAQRRELTRIVFSTKLDFDNLRTISYILHNIDMLDMLNEPQTTFIDVKNALSLAAALSAIGKYKESKQRQSVYKNITTCLNGELQFYIASDGCKKAFDHTKNKTIIFPCNRTKMYKQYITKLNLIRHNNIDKKIDIKIYKDQKYKIELGEGDKNIIDGFLLNNTSYPVNVFKITISYHSESHDEDSICLLHHKKIGDDDHGIISMIFDIEANLFRQKNSKSRAPPRQVEIFDDVTAYFLSIVLEKVMLLQVTYSNLKIPNFFRTPNSSLLYMQKLIEHELNPPDCFPDLHKHLQAGQAKKISLCTFAHEEYYDYGFQKLSDPNILSMPSSNFTKSTVFSDFEDVIFRLMLNHRFDYSLLNNFLTFERRSFDLEQAIYVMDDNQNKTVIQILTSRRKNYSLLGYCHQPIEIFLSLIKIHEENERYGNNILDLRFYVNRIKSFITKLLYDGFFDLDRSNIKTNLPIMDELIRVVDSKMLEKCNKAVSRLKHRTEERKPLPCESIIYKTIIKPLIQRYVECVLVKIYSLASKEEIGLTTIKICKNKDANLSTDRNGIAGVYSQNAIDNYMDLEEYEELFTDVFKKLVEKNKIY